MKKILIVTALLLAPVLLVAALTQTAARAAQTPALLQEAEQPSVTTSDCFSGTQASGAEYLICTPDGWHTDDDLLVYAHGYVAPDRPVEIPEDQMVLGDISITQTVTSLGYAFATTSYATNGLAVRPAISDLLNVVNIFTTTNGTPNHIYLVGVSEGGLITTLSVERYPNVYDGGLAMCGPYGDFLDQTDHFADFRVVFDYFFPGLMLGTPITIPESAKTSWEEEAFYAMEIEPLIASDESVTDVNQLLNVTGVSPYSHDPPTNTGVVTSVVENLLWYNVFATEDAKAKLGGSPFDNQDRQYTGSRDDAALNAGVARFSADPEVLETISDHYQTTGKLTVPLVTLHTTGDPVVPYWHAVRYRGKTIAADNIALHRHRTVDRHGHCAFGIWDILTAFSELEGMVKNPPEHQPVKRLFLPGVRAD